MHLSVTAVLWMTSARRIATTLAMTCWNDTWCFCRWWAWVFQLRDAGQITQWTDNDPRKASRHAIHALLSRLSDHSGLLSPLQYANRLNTASYVSLSALASQFTVFSKTKFRSFGFPVWFSFWFIF